LGKGEATRLLLWTEVIGFKPLKPTRRSSWQFPSGP